MQDFLEYVRGELDKLKKGGREFPGLYEFLSLIFYCGFKINELTMMSIADVASANHRKWSSSCQEAIDKYLEEMTSRLKSIPDPDSPLFPEYYGENGRRKFNRHFGLFEEDFYDLNHAAIRIEGLLHTENELLGHSRNDENTLKLAEWYNVHLSTIKSFYKKFGY